jgi:hypothetical protein
MRPHIAAGLQHDEQPLHLIVVPAVQQQMGSASLGCHSLPAKLCNDVSTDSLNHRHFT